MSDAPVLAVERLGVRYGRQGVLEEISLGVRRGAVYALLGRNGAGKSSLVRCALGQQKPSAGRVLLFDEDVWPTRKTAMARVGVVPEEPDAPPEMKARQLVALCGRFYRTWNQAAVYERLERFQVPLDIPFARLSKGEKGGAMLALALGHSPELLVLDDPTLGLDLIARREVFTEIIGELADRGTTVFLTTHDLAGIEGMADRVAILRDHRLVVDEELEALKVRRGQSLEEIFAEVAGPERGVAA
jgi:ABC-2 type transport system ATP-binding protein